MPDILTSLHGRKLGLGVDGNLIAGQAPITAPCAGATITVGDEAANVRAITIQLETADGSDIDYAETVFAYLVADAAEAAFVTTGGSTGIEIGTDGALLALVAKKAFVLISETDGDIDLTWTDTGTEAAYLVLVLPTGRKIVSDALTNAA